MSAAYPMTCPIERVRIVYIAPRTEAVPDMQFIVVQDSPMVMIVAEMPWTAGDEIFEPFEIRSTPGALDPGLQEGGERIEAVLRDELWEIDPIWSTLLVTADARTHGWIGAPPEAWTGVGVVACEQLLSRVRAATTEDTAAFVARLAPLTIDEELRYSPGEKVVRTVALLIRHAIRQGCKPEELPDIGR